MKIHNRQDVDEPFSYTTYWLLQEMQNNLFAPRLYAPGLQYGAWIDANIPTIGDIWGDTIISSTFETRICPFI